MKIADDDLKAAYEKQKDTFHKPETRHVLQMLLPDEAHSRPGRAGARRRQGFPRRRQDDREAGRQHRRSGFGQQGRPADEIASVAFDAKNGRRRQASAQRTRLDRGQDCRIEPEATKSFDEVKPQLETELRNDAERDALDKLADNVQNALSGGVDLNAIAQQFNLKPVTVASVDDGAKDPAGNILSTLPIPAAAVMKTVFETANGQASGLEEIKDGSGYYVVKVDTVTAPALRPFDEVKDKVVAGWQAEQRTAKVAADGKALADSVKPDLTLAKAAVAKKLELRTSKPFTRTNDRRDAPLPPDVVAALFKGDVGTVARRRHARWVLRRQLKEIQPAATGTDPNATAQLKKQLDQEMGSEMVDEFELALRDRYPVDVRHAAIDQLLGGGPSQ
ncbi:MAG: peptidyl-prolyl cis-trans isomerase [Aliidongia sp.]